MIASIILTACAVIAVTEGRSPVLCGPYPECGPGSSADCEYSSSRSCLVCDGCKQSCPGVARPRCGPGEELDCSRRTADGCPAGCTCRSSCPLRKCIPCPNGYEIKDGCQTCTCKANQCPRRPCRKRCRNGFQKDSNGCETCRCKRRQCSNRFCRRACRNGFQTDSDGCPICRCKDDREVRPCPAVAPPRCGPGEELDCSRKTADGCQAGCTCKKGGCVPPRCRRACRDGFQTDSNGCEICRCKEDRGITFYG